MHMCVQCETTAFHGLGLVIAWTTIQSYAVYSYCLICPELWIPWDSAAFDSGNTAFLLSKNSYNSKTKPSFGKSKKW